MNTTRKRS